MKKTLFVSMRKLNDTFSPGDDWVLHFSAYKPGNCDTFLYVPVQEIEVEIDDDYEKVLAHANNMEILQLEETIKKINAAAHAKVVSIKERIQSLKAIENKG